MIFFAYCLAVLFILWSYRYNAAPDGSVEQAAHQICAMLCMLGIAILGGINAARDKE